jgi:hypothetical protein
MARRRENYYSRRQAEEERLGQRTQNIGARIAEKVGIQSDWEIADAREEPKPVYKNMTAPTENPSRPRALKLAYSREAQKLVIKFRDGTWWEYNNVNVEIWNGLKASPSTGKYLNGKYSSGVVLDTWPDMGPFNPAEMPAETRVIFNS